MRSFFPLTNQWAEKQRDRYLYGLPMALGVERLTTSKSGVGFSATAY